MDLTSDLDEEELMLSRTLECLYVLRCLTGPIVESLIALDRYAFLEEWIEGEEGTTVELVNLFNQHTGSLRNLALVWKKDGHAE